MTIQNEELVGLLIITAIGVGLSLLGKLTTQEVNLLTYTYGAFAASKGLSNLMPGPKQ